MVPWPALHHALHTLDFRDNKLTGTLPPSILQLDNLEDLWFSQNNLTGQLPDFTQAPSLSLILMAYNQLTGTLPGSISSTSIALIDFAGNQLTGTIPADWHQAPQLTLLSLSGNSLSGPLTGPDEDAALGPSLAELELGAAMTSTQRGLLNLILDNNQLTGTLPKTLALLPITVFIISHNQFSGTLPSNIFSWPYARDIEISHNNFAGPLPKRFDSLALEVLDISDNAITGTIPPLIANASSIRVLTLSRNKLSGPLPLAFWQLQQMRLLFLEDSGMSHQGPLNPLGQPLPLWMLFDMSNGRTGGFAQEQAELVCYPVMANTTIIPLLSYINMDPSYYNHSRCSCIPGYDYHPTAVPRCVQHIAGPLEGRGGWLHVALPTALVVALLMATTFFLLRWMMPGKRALKKAKKAAAALEKQTTVVLTSIEGIQELQHWNASAMRSARFVHDRILRSQMSKHNGHELHCENDSFVIQFDEAADAVAWCLATQQALLDAVWPPQLQQYLLTRTQTEGSLAELAGPSLQHAGGLGDHKVPIWKGSSIIKHSSITKTVSAEATIPASNVNPPMTPSSPSKKKRLQWDADIEGHQADTIKAGKAPGAALFAGLRVRMAVVTGYKHRESRGRSIELPLQKSTEQYSKMLEIATALGKAIHGGQVMVEAKAFSSINNSLTDIASRVPEAPASRGGSGHGLQSFVTALNVEAAESSPDATGKSGLFQIMRSKSMESKRSDNSYGGEQSAVSRLLSFMLRGHSHTSQGDRDAQYARAGREGVMVIDMGLHLLPGLQEPQQLHQVLVPGLQERARLLPPLLSIKQISPGYFDAPLTKESPLSANTGYLPRKPVTLVFTLMDKYAQMKLENPGAAQLALTLYRDCLRKTLVGRGTECQELDGSFMLAFKTVIDAIQFCVLGQEALLGVAWGSAVLALGSCKPMISETTQTLVWQGPRVKMGIYEGVPTKVTPHSTTGRADYFGPFVNRCARICNSGAQGGQILTSWDVVQRAVSHWAPTTEIATPVEGQAPVVVSCGLQLAAPQAPGAGLAAARSSSVEPLALTSALEAWQRQSSLAEADIPSGQAAPETASNGASKAGAPAAGRLTVQVPGKLALGTQQAAYQQEISTESEQGIAAAAAGLSTAGPSIAAQHSMSSRFANMASPGQTMQRADGIPGQDSNIASPLSEAACLSPDDWAERSIRSMRSGPESRMSMDMHPGDGGLGAAAICLGSYSGHNEDAWKGITHLQIHHAGQFKFKGWVDPQALMQINSGRLAGRTFTAVTSSGKAQLLQAGQGLKVTLVFEDNLQHVRDMMAGIASDSDEEPGELDAAL
ncbi:hypothetical protein WJX72_001669 [[Myrmecia] bisecta]|uniref:Adenylate cyclase n=1 Tax=[Myrmecia] bisecta TaxID=41462 RepID=A0AAW1R4L9_9CHLO